MKRQLAFFLMLIAGLFIIHPDADVNAGVDGMPPDQACNLLNDIGLATFGWNTYDDNESKCASRSVQIGSGNPFKNSLAFHVEGAGQTVHRLKLIVSVLNPLESDEAHDALKKAAQNLLLKITAHPAPELLLTAISNGQNLSLQTGGFTVDVIRREWTMNTDWTSVNCHELTVMIH